MLYNLDKEFNGEEMEEDDINYKLLRKIQQLEKNSPILTELTPNFYYDLSNYLDNLKKRLDSETSSQKQILLNDEIKNTVKISINIYEQREKKILLAVASKVRGGSPNLKNMTEIEKSLFDDILDKMLTLRKKILKIKKNSKNQNNNIDQNKNKDEKKIEQRNHNINPLIRITKDIPEFIGTDEKKYNLRKNDILSLTDDMSKMLVKRGVAEEISN
jgi:DNA replication initiation complex subunit (GINS family)